MWRANDCVLSIDTFKDLFGDKIKMFYGYAQHDTQEALNSLFMTIENELNIKTDYTIDKICPNVQNLMNKRDYYSKLISTNNLSKEEKQKIFNEYEEYKKNNNNAVRGIDAYKSWKKYNKNNRNIIVDIFTGYFHVETTCPDCNFISDKFESFNCLPLTIVTKNKQFGLEDVDIYDCLDEFYKTETLDDNNKWYCDKCEKKVNAIRRFYMWKKPKVLILLLKRFDYSRNFKTSNKVNFPLNDLNLNKHTSYLNKIEEDKKYNLFAISNHQGNMLGGHHFSYCKNDEKWYEYNDDKVKYISDEGVFEQKIITNKAYLLFYQLSD